MIRDIFKYLTVMAVVLQASFAGAKEIPMWEGLTKSEQQQKADTELIEAARKAGGGTLVKATYRAIQLGWQFVAQGDPETAIKRFNQAWLFEPDNADIHWGFAVATALQGAPLSTVERHFAQAESVKKNDAALFADHGRVLQQRGENQRAIVYFKKSLSINPDHRDAHVGMMLASAALGDMKTAEEHRRLLGK
ncbi:tetratricopeptide repeat protein [Rhizobium sp. AG855]|uniref:tetratricopeptide repeat protein n=1 Tax=Rhizobium sp. AG855 TaxID=2183898 RepID=UPI000E74B0CD|nr:tetratricopeptide repeat protein [Rhizobium sp. AG855]RKE83566.1 tetratricopeptide repeat protein [Rhizobium sp. AG855]